MAHGQGNAEIALDCSPTLSCNHEAPILAFDCKRHGVGDVDVAPTLRAMGHADSHANAGGQVAVAYAFQPRIGRSGRGQPSEIVPTLAGASAGATSDSRPCVVVESASLSTSAVPVPTVSLKLDNGSSQPIGGVELTPPLCQGGPTGSANVAVFTNYIARRITPLEAERLQGFPDNFTLIPFRGKPAADGPRYRALGNSMAVPVVAWIGRRIDMVDRIIAALRENPALVNDGDNPNEHPGLLELAGMMEV